MDALTPLAMPATAAAPAEQSVLIILGLAAMAWPLCRRPWQLLRRDDLQNGWLGALVFLALLWTLPGGLAIQLFGATLVVTLFGLPLALLSLFVVDLVSFLGLGYLEGDTWLRRDWAALRPRYFWMGLLPALLSAARDLQRPRGSSGQACYTSFPLAMSSLR